MKYVILGASAAGISAARTIRSLDKECEIVVISKDNKVYSRCMLHLVLGQERTVEEIAFIERDFFEKNDIEWISGVKVKSLNSLEKFVQLQNGDKVGYDKLLIATGASASIPPIKNLKEAKNVACLRDIEDSIFIRNNIKPEDNVVVIGGGLVGVDATVGLIRNSVNTTLVEMGDRVLPLQLDRKAAAAYEKLFAKNNVDVKTAVGVKEVILDENAIATSVVLSSGETIPCNFIVVAAGVKSNMEFIENTGIEANRGIIIDEYCKTNVEDIFAAGDVTALAPIWSVAVKQGKNAAYNMLGMAKKYSDNFAAQNSMNFLGLQTVSVGMVQEADDSYEVEVLETKDFYKKIIHKDGIVYGAILQGEVSYCGVITYVIKHKIDTTKLGKNLFDISFADFYGINEAGEYVYA